MKPKIAIISILNLTAFPFTSWLSQPCAPEQPVQKLDSMKLISTKKMSGPLTWHTPVGMGRNTMSEFHISQIQYMGETCPAPQGLRGGVLAWLQQPPAPRFVWLHPVNQIPTVTQKNWGLISDADY